MTLQPKNYYALYNNSYSEDYIWIKRKTACEEMFENFW
jgi:hypothetical protein